MVRKSYIRKAFIISEKSQMSDLINPTNQEISCHSDQIFNQHWGIYQKIVKYNYMKHRELRDILHDFLVKNFRDSFKILDIGCGDASFSAEVLSDTKVASYQGVDLSEAALNLAPANMKKISGEQIFVQNNFINVVGELVRSQTENFDVILSSFSLHHLSREEKENLIDALSHILKKQGVFILVDIILKAQETRENYLKRYLNYVMTEWHLITTEEFSLIENHVTSSDFPETQETFKTLAKKYNFSGFECIHLSPLYTEQILCFYK
jgi:ubiquinone/menaquinone biosynthesis C-methylase UbiE